MDARTLGLLEFDKVRELVAGYAACSLGRDLAGQLEPLTDFARISAELKLVSEMVIALDLGQAPPFGGLHDIRLLVRRAAIGSMLTAEQLLEVGETLNCTGAIYRYRMRLDERCQGLIELLAAVEDYGPLAKTIAGCIDGRGRVLDMASRELAEIRRKLTEVDEKVQSQIRRLLRDPKLREILRYPNATVSGDHYVLPVAANHRLKVAGTIHRTSSTGETLFIEPAEISHLSAERTVLKGDEDREERRILRKLSAEVGKFARQITAAVDVLARFDLVNAKARYARDFRMECPDLDDSGKLWLRQARHPVLEHLFRQPSDGPTKSVVPIDVRLGIEFNLLIITGPNTGGKTVTLKTVGLLAMMAQAGLHIPAGPGSKVPVFRHILADIGDEQSLEQSLSTFSSHISHIAHILKTADAESLVLLDELGAGTDPTEGAALGRAILDGLDLLGCRAMVTTHLGDLKTYAFNNDRAENAAVEFDTESLRPTYRLLMGQFGMSNALKIARRLKLPKHVLLRARRYLQRKQKRAPELARLQELRAEAEKARDEALQVQHSAELQRQEYEKAVGRVKQEAEAVEQLRVARSRFQPGDKARVSRFNEVGKIVRIDLKKQTATVGMGLGQWEVKLDELFPVE